MSDTSFVPRFRNPAPTVQRSFYPYEEGFDPWAGDILKAPPGSLPPSFRSYTGSEASVPFLQESFVVHSRGSKLGRTLSQAPSLGQRGLRPESLQASASVPNVRGWQARRGEGAGHSQLSVQAKRVPSTADFQSPASVYSETPSSPAPRDRFDADMKLAQLNFDQRTEMRQMVSLSTTALNEMVGLTAEELHIADDDEDEDELEAEAAVLRKKASTKHFYESSLRSYRADALQAQQTARKAINPSGIKIDRKPTRAAPPDDFLSYLEETPHERLYTGDYLDIVKASGWNLNILKEELKSRNLMTEVEVEEPEESENSDDAEPEQDEADESVAEAEDSEVAQAEAEQPASEAAIDPQLALEGGPSNVSEFLGTQSSYRSFAGEDSLLPSLWSTSCGTHSIENKNQAVSRKGAQVTALPQLQGRLSPILLMQLKYIGQSLLQENMRRLILLESRRLPKDSDKPMRHDMKLTGLEELMLREASKVPGWELGPMEPGLFEAQVKQQLAINEVEGSRIQAQILAVLSLSQLSKRVVLEPSFTHGDGHCAMHMVGSNISVYDLPSLLHVLKWPVNQARQAILASNAVSQEIDSPGSSRASSPCRPSSALSRRSSTRSVGFTSRHAPSKATAGHYPVGSSQGRLRTLRSLASRYTSQVFKGDQLESASDEDQSETASVHLEATVPGPLDKEFSFCQCHSLCHIPPHDLEGVMVTKLVLSGNLLNDEACAVLALGLRDCENVTHLDMSRNPLLTWRSCVCLGELLSTRVKACPRQHLIGSGKLKLEYLDLSGIPIGDKGVAFLAEPLKQNRSLKRLLLNYCNIGETGAHHLGWTFLENQIVEDLQLGYNRLFFKGAAELSLGLKANTGLTSLDVRSNGLGDKGAAYFGNVLVDNRALKCIDLSSNRIRSGGCLVLAEAINCNSVLTTMLLHDNPLGGEGGNHLLIALAENKALTRFGLQGSSFVDIHSAPTPSSQGNVDEMKSFSRRNPNGNYRLDLDDPTHRQIAVELWRLREAQGADSWTQVKMNGKPLKITNEMGWPARIPEEGTLQLRFDTVMAPPGNAEPMDYEDFENIRKEIYNLGANDQWRLTLLRLICGTHYFTSKQADILMRAFVWGRERVEACTILFGRVVDPHNVSQLTGSLDTDEKRDLHERLGMLAFFRPDNPTAHYSLNLSRQLDRVIAARLLVSSIQEGYWKSQPILANFRNVTVNGEPIMIKDPGKYELPQTGWMTFDYITYKFGTVLEGKKKRQDNRKIYSPITSIQFESLLKALEVLKDVEVDANNRRKERHVKRLQAAESAAPADESGGDSGQVAGRKTIAAKFLLNLQTKAVQDAEQVVDEDEVQDADELDLESARTRPTSVLELFRELIRQQEAHKVEDELRQQVSEQRAAKLAAEQQKESAEGQDDDDDDDDDDGDEASDKKEQGQEEPKLLSQKSIKTVEAVSGSGDSASKLPADISSSKIKIDWAGKKRWQSVVKKVHGIQGAFEHLQLLFDEALPNCTAIELLRAFAGVHYVTCRQVLMILKLFNFDSALNGTAAIQKTTVIQILFTRLSDTYHCADLLRVLDRPSQIILNRRIGYHNTILTSMRPDFSHLHGLYFRLRLGVEDEHLCMKKIAEYICHIPNKPLPGSNEVKAILKDMHINGEPASVAEDKQLWKLLLMVGKERKKPSASWDPAGTIEFQLWFPPRWLHATMAPKIQRAWRAYKQRKIASTWREVVNLQAMKHMGRTVVDKISTSGWGTAPSVRVRKGSVRVRLP